MKPEYCPECRSTNLKSIDLRGEVVCMSCGLVIDEANFEINPFVATALKNRASLPFLSKAGSKVENGRIFKNTWLYSTNEKNTLNGLSEIDLIAEKLNLPTYVVDEAKIIFKQIMEKKYSWGRGLAYLGCSCIYLACNIFKLPKTANEISLYSSLNRYYIAKYAKNIAKKLYLDIERIDPLDLIPRFASNLDLSQKTLIDANELIIKIKEEDLLVGRRPETITAVALYLASIKNGETRTQREITNNTGVAERTLRNISKLIK